MLNNSLLKSKFYQSFLLSTYYKETFETKDIFFKITFIGHCKSKQLSIHELEELIKKNFFDNSCSSNYTFIISKTELSHSEDSSYNIHRYNVVLRFKDSKYSPFTSGCEEKIDQILSVFKPTYVYYFEKIPCYKNEFFFILGSIDPEELNNIYLLISNSKDRNNFYYSSNIIKLRICLQDIKFVTKYKNK